jgi:hypothetical protein
MKRKKKKLQLSEGKDMYVASQSISLVSANSQQYKDLDARRE